MSWLTWPAKSSVVIFCLNRLLLITLFIYWTSHHTLLAEGAFVPDRTLAHIAKPAVCTFYSANDVTGLVAAAADFCNR